LQQLSGNIPINSEAGGAIAAGPFYCTAYLCPIPHFPVRTGRGAYGKNFGPRGGAVCAIALGNCVPLQTPTTDSATDCNHVIADLRNEMILLNIVRAQFREPTQYSTLSQVNGNMLITARPVCWTRCAAAR